METMVIRGGRRLQGTVTASGSKNASLAIMAACLLADGTSRVTNVPDVQDIRTMCTMLEILGARARMQDNVFTLDPKGFASRPAPYELVKTMRASIYVLAPLLSRFGKAQVALPGGCAIGQRPIDQHLKGLEALGAQVSLEHGYIHTAAPHGLKGADIYLDVASVGATVNIMLAAVLAAGKTVIDHAACEPEIVDLAEGLNRMGADIKGAGSSRIEIKGQRQLGPMEHRVITDRIEAGTLAVAGAITAGDITIRSFPGRHLTALEKKLGEAGVEVVPAAGDAVQIKRLQERLAPVDIVTLPYPGFPTDLQAQWMALMCLAAGRSVVTETIWENRFLHVAELKRMGADIQIEGSNALVRGGALLSGAQVMASDLRASAALILAGLVAEGETTVSRIYHLDRGYEQLEEKLASLGADIQRIRE
ncbi:UDP-N-acetylglucosamine 1-carboxyvinyltransferase [candidate division FCPU426 bacterium]|nr:UDP-N-acetylglucosamine 1-carboxyvinyltransferase [candidate division FCPU426 bacterium]